jgi:predicted Zn-dependent protease
MSILSATYFDGITASAQPVTLSLRHETGIAVWHLEGDAIQNTHPARSVRLAPAVGSASRFLYFPDGGSCEISDAENLQRALESLHPSRPEEIAGARLRWLEKRAFLVAVAAVLFTIGAALTFHWMLPLLARGVAAAMPPSIGRTLGGGTLEALDQEILQPTWMTTVRQTEIKMRFNQLVRMSGHSGVTSIQFRRMHDGTANAFALPDGTIILTDRLILIAASDDEIMAILAHELGHLHHRHSLRQLLQDSITLLLVTSVTGDSSTLNNFAGALPRVVLSAKYSRDHEREADAFALTALTKAGIPSGAFLLIMNRIEQDTRRIYKENPPPFLSTHPPTDERLETYRKADQLKSAR